MGHDFAKGVELGGSKVLFSNMGPKSQVLKT